MSWRRFGQSGGTARRACCAIVAAVLWVGATPATSHAEGIFSEPWTVWVTEHFRLHAHRDIAPMGDEVAEMLEDAHEAIVPWFGWEPVGRVHVTLEDRTDGANGIASTVPWNDIRLYGVPPTHESSLSYYDNYMWNLVVHEYVHIVHISRVGGIPRFFNRWFDTEFSPGHAVPRWFTEGLATWFESELTGTGRLNSAYFDAYWRGAALDGTFPTMGDLSGDPIYWPHGTGWYLYGAHFMDTLIERVGFDALQEFLEVYSRQVIPYRINRIAERTMGVTLTEVWPEMHAARAGQAHADALIARLSGGGRPEHLTTMGHSTRTLALAPDGTPAWLRDDGHSGQAIVHGDREVNVETAGGFDFLSADLVVIDQPHGVDRFFAFRDLYELDLRTGDTRPITWGQRAREPAVSPDRTRVAFSAVTEGRSELRVLDLETGDVTTVLPTARWEQANTPAWIDDDHLVFSYLIPGQGRDLYRVALADGQVTRITHDHAFAIDPHVSDGFVVFSSDRSGIHDLYTVPMDGGDIRRLTHVDTGAFAPIIADGFAVFSVLGGTGFDVARVPVGALTDAPLAPPVANPMVPIPRPKTTVVAEGRVRAPITQLRRPDWTPQLGFSTAGGGGLGLQFATSDAPGVNLFDAVVQWSTEHQQPLASLAFETHRLPLALGVGLSRNVITRTSGFERDGEALPFVEDQYNANFATSIPFPRLGSTHSLGFGYGMNWYRIADTPPEPAPDPVDIPPRSPDYVRFNALRISWGWSRVERYTHSFTNERGTRADVSLRIRSPAIGAEVQSAELTASVTHFAPLPWGHVVAMRAAGGISEARGVGRRTFTVGGLGTHDVFLALQESTPAGTSQIRGYEPGVRTGNQYYRGQLEYRFPLLRIGAGDGTLPAYVERMWGVVFVDTADATDRRVAPLDALWGTGAELRLATTLGYSQAANFRAGFARGWGRDGIWDVYFLYGFEY